MTLAPYSHLSLLVHRSVHALIIAELLYMFARKLGSTPRQRDPIGSL
jgi:hypothetical protein